MKSSLGKLEREVMDVLWDSKGYSLKDVFQSLREKRPIAYTTVATVLSRLYAKGLLRRGGGKDNHRYYPIMSKDLYVRSLSRTFLKTLINSFGDIAVSSFAESIESLPKQKKQHLLKVLSHYESNR